MSCMASIQNASSRNSLLALQYCSSLTYTSPTVRGSPFWYANRFPVACHWYMNLLYTICWIIWQSWSVDNWEGTELFTMYLQNMIYYVMHCTVYVDFQSLPEAGRKKIVVAFCGTFIAHSITFGVLLYCAYILNVGCIHWQHTQSSLASCYA